MELPGDPARGASGLGSPRLAPLVVTILLAATAAPPRVAVLDVEPPDQGRPGDRPALTGALAEGLADRTAWQLVTLRDLEALLGLERQRQILGDCRGDSCVADVASKLDAAAVVVASALRSGPSVLVSARLVHPRTGAVMIQASESGPEAELHAMLRRAGQRLLRGWRESRGLGVSSGRADCADADACDAACRSGNAAACDQLGSLLLMKPVPARARAAAAFERACALGVPAACRRGASAFEALGWLPAAAPLLARACREAADAEACLRAGRLRREGREVAADPQEAAWLLERACALGQPGACASPGEKGPRP